MGLPRFFTLSAAVHTAAVIAITALSIPLAEQIKPETITFDIAEPEVRLPTQGAPVMPTQGGAPAVQQAELPPIKSQDLGSPSEAMDTAAPQLEEKIVTAPTIAPVITASAKPAKAAPVVKAVAPKTTAQAVPMTIDDINSPELDEGEVAATPVAAKLNDDYSDDFEKIDNSNSQALEEEQGKMVAMADALNAEQEEALNSAAKANEQEAANLAAEQEALRKKNAKAVASAIASERAAAARAQAEREAAAKAAAESAAHNGNGGEGTGSGQAAGAGAGNNGTNQASDQIAGTPEGVRSLDQLRQMPNNPRPQYDRDERLRGDQGKVSFLAYITKEGVPIKFRKIQSSGYTNLDSKTLQALKQWRFYPGQEGWVEMPFRWDLKGGAQQDGGRLRTAVSQM